MNSLLLAQVKAAKLPPAYVYVASLGRYRDAVTGRFVALKTVLGLLNSNETASLEKMQKLSRFLAEDKLPGQAWHLAMQQQLRRLTVQNAALAAGGFDALKQRDLQRIDAALRDDFERLQRFGADITAGRLSQAQIDSRVALYAGHARMQYYAALPKPATQPNQVVLERRKLGESEQHCAYCVYLANLGWQPYGSLPLPGESDPDWQDEQCLTHCHCDLERQVFSQVEAATLVKAFFAFDYSYTNKGGEGSGNFGHAGRPGERGGSAPQNGKLLPNYQAESFTVPKGNDLAFDEAIQRYAYNGHPLLTLYLGKQDTSMASSDWLASLPGLCKGEVVDKLAKGTGLPGYECDHFIEQWANSSNDNNAASLTIQEEAAQMFGGELTDWQRKRLHAAQATREWIINSAIGRVPEEPAALLAAGEDAYQELQRQTPYNNLLAFERAGFRKMLDDLADEVDYAEVDLTTAELRRRIAAVEQEAKEKTRKALRFVYDHTQATLKQAGIKELHLYRGALLNDSETTHLKVGDAVQVQSNALSSWSLAQETAAEFAEGVGSGQINAPGKRAVTFDAIVPASRIYSIPITGQGCLLEWEAIVIGSPQDTVRVYAVDDDVVKAFIKGGEGSGNHGHAGRPGQQGGSAPSAGRAALTAPTDDLPDFEAKTPYRKHPYVAAYAGDRPEFLNGHLLVSTKQASALKAQVSERLAKEIGADPADVSALLHAWATTANGDMPSMAIQQAAALEFDVPLSPWQHTQYTDLYAEQKAFFRERLLAYREQGDSDLRAVEETFYEMADEHAPRFLPFQGAEVKRAAMGGDVPKTAAEADAFFDRTATKALQTTRKALRSMYDQTQAQFKAWGMDTVRASRGFSAVNATADNWREGDTVQYQMNALSSWSLSRTRSEFFSGNTADATLLESAIPVSRIVALPTTGLGSAYEWEIVVLGASRPDTAKVIYRNAGTKTFIKGGEGSGNFGHAGRPGHQGGSAPAATVSPMTDQTEHDAFPVEVSGEVDALAEFGLDRAALAKCMDIGLPSGCRAFIKAQRTADGELSLLGQWVNEDGRGIGLVERYLEADHTTARLDELSFESMFIGRGFGKRAAEQWYHMLADAGYTTAKLEADMTIGRYAWAKEGAQYEDTSMPRWATDEFRKWAGRHNIFLKSDEWPRFTNPQDVASYAHPYYSLSGLDIENEDVPYGMDLPLGKAFMLDKGRYGHGSWNAIIDLTQWRTQGRSSKATFMPIDSKTSNWGYIEARGVSDASDAAFWSQYLTEEEGEPLFGFGEQFGKSFSIKGGEGSGNFGHAGIPGHQGGSQPTGQSTARTGLRADWAQAKHYLLYAYASDTPWESSMRDEAARITEFRQKTDARIKLIEDLSQEERADLYVSLTRAKSGYSLFQTKYDDTFQAALATGDKQKIAEVLSQMEPEQWVKDDHVFKLLASRLDEDHALQVMQALAEDERQYRAKYPKGSKVPYDEESKHGTHFWGAHALQEVGPTDKFRREAVALYRAAGGDSMSVAIASGNVEQDMANMVRFWTTDSRTPGNPWVHAAAAKAFGGAEQVVGYWNYMSYGVVYNDPDPGYVAAAKAIYQKTQAFYAKKKNKTFTVLRGVKAPVSVRSPLESWTLSQKTATFFDGYAVMERTEPVERVFMTWEAMKGIFPPEKDLNGKKEVVLLGPDWMKP
jgi:hypothetical protein